MRLKKPKEPGLKNPKEKDPKTTKFNTKKGQYRSKLEEYAANLLKESGIEFKYESPCIQLLPPIKPLSIFLEGTKKGMQHKDGRAMTYTPDFTGVNWLIETKGHRTPDFDIKWKVLKNTLGLPYDFYCMPRNKAQVNQCVEYLMSNIIKVREYPIRPSPD